ncbi:MAG: DNRLRE domain-containing protein [Planctomycetes bacterium]|nr:DNRLRE domain-containing protein [Planctomycetota bacterium]
MLVRPIAVLVLSTAGLCASHAPGDVVTFAAANDSTLFESPDGSLAGGKGEYLFVGKTLIGQIRRTVLRFDVAANVPAGAIIDSAIVTLHMSRTPTTGTDVSFFRLTQQWTEGATDPPGEEGAGGITVSGDVTWIHTAFDTSSWNTPGGDFAAAASASTMVFGNDFYTWDLTTDAQHMLDAPSLNYGWCLIGEEGAEATAKRFDSRENSVIEFRPSMRVEYHLIPAPGIALAPLFGLWVAKRRNRQAAVAIERNRRFSRSLDSHI